jgi:hypothetical protein
MVWGAVDDFFQHYWMHMIFACMNAGFLSYAIIQYVGVQATWQDLRVCVRQYSSWCGDALEMRDTQISSMESEKSIATGSLPLSPRPKYELSTKERMIMQVHRRRISLLALGD